MSKKAKVIIAVILGILVIVLCFFGIAKIKSISQAEKTTALKTTSAEESKEDEERANKRRIKNECFNMSEWLISDMWNDCFCDLSWYYESKADACGEQMDVEYTLHKLEKNYKELEHYDSFIESLEGKEYDELKYIWSKLKPEMQRLYDLAFEIEWSECPKDDEKFSTDLYSQYSSDMEEELDKFD